MTDSILITLDAATLECGDAARGTVQWELDETPRALVVELGFRTAGKGTVDSSVGDSIRLPGSASGTARFELQVPLAGPITYEGALIRILWLVEARADHALQRDVSCSTGVTVLPRDGLTLWARRSAPPPPVV